MKIKIQTIPHNEQRYDTVGDWIWNENNLELYISDMNNWKYEFLVAMHELTEVMLCKDRNISQESVDSFDIKYEEERLAGLHKDDEEPGWDKKAPYRNEHIFAEIIERQIAKELGVDWQDYDKAVNEL